ncbi:Ger(x)C family spore germination protein [Cytobacillus praedii]|uniref:Ger(x)C family spore germination protein n=1 Tax=Cytobacillus praedii TaxID=1742358 RepID=UPI002E2455CF|nr:Ger(x)C family spore germination protein [Cytobacillus praedii]MED3553299.1 Ger(x)C family spore germination protein [Cytobacillus praedii]
MNRIIHIPRIIIFLLSLLLTTGCSNDINEVQNLNFATAIGVDFKDNKYHIYIQMLGLSSVAKTEDATNAPPQVYLSETIGETFIDAFFKAYRTSQERIIWAHVTAIVLSESALNKGIENIYDGLTRYYEFRPTPWVFGTLEPIADILSANGFFNQSSLNTILHSPQSSYEQGSWVRPIRLNKFARELLEPVQTTYIPTLKINRKQWKKNKEAESKLEINGAFFLKNKEYKGFFELNDIKGIRWIASETERASILVPSKENPEFLSVFEEQYVKIIPIKVNGRYKYDVVFFAKGYISNRLKNNVLNVNHMQNFVKDSIISQIKDFYQLGLDKNIDFLNLEYQLYRKHNSKWKQMTKKNEPFLEEDSINDFKAYISLQHSGSFKKQKIKIDD